MWEDALKIKAYRIHQRGQMTIADVAAGLAARHLPDRDLGMQSQLRLEEIRVGQRLLYLDFAQRRTGHGPGRMGRAAPIREIDLGADEHFGEDTGVVVDMHSGYAAIQYNHHGPKVSAIEEYMRIAEAELRGVPANVAANPDRSGFVWATHLNSDGYTRLGNLGIYREVSVEINVPGATEQDFVRGRALGQILDHALPQGTETVTLTFKAAAPRDSSLGDQGVEGWLTDIRRLGDSVQKATVRGRRAERAPIEEIDLIEEQLSQTVDLRVHRGERYAREDRWQALGNALEFWHGAGQLPVAPT